MSNTDNNVPLSGTIILLFVFVNTIILKTAFIHRGNYYWALMITLPLLLLAIYSSRQKKHTGARNYPDTRPFAGEGESANKTFTSGKSAARMITHH